jgi:hypothetical protein
MGEPGGALRPQDAQLGKQPIAAGHPRLFGAPLLLRGHPVGRSRGADGALSAVVAAVTALEDDPHFNAGIGAVRNADGEVELDAGVMTAERLRTGAVAGMTDSARPVSVARAVLEDGRHVLLAGAGASRFAAERGLPLAGRERLRESARALPGSARGTVGAVRRDARGGLAVAVSTGGVSATAPSAAPASTLTPPAPPAPPGRARPSSAWPAAGGRSRCSRPGWTPRPAPPGSSRN